MSFTDRFVEFWWLILYIQFALQILALLPSALLLFNSSTNILCFSCSSFDRSSWIKILLPFSCVLFFSTVLRVFNELNNTRMGLVYVLFLFSPIRKALSISCFVISTLKCSSAMFMIISSRSLLSSSSIFLEIKFHFVMAFSRHLLLWFVIVYFSPNVQCFRKFFTEMSLNTWIGDLVTLNSFFNSSNLHT